ncbi:MAG: class I adenylate-forming enzyme family protein [Ilumatobacteraceae bacterium]
MSCVSIWLDRAARRSPDTLALATATDSVTYRELDRRVESLARRLIGTGLRPGDRVLDWHHNGIESVCTTVAIARAGLVRVPVSPQSTPAEVAQIVDHAEVDALVCDDALTAAALEVAHRTARPPLLLGHRNVDGADPFRSLADAEPVAGALAGLAWTDVSSIRYTSGTTGAPKAVVLTEQAEVLSMQVIAAESCRMTAEDRFLHLQPFSHGGGAYVPPMILAGASGWVLGKFDATAALQWIEQHRITVIKLVPTMLIRMLESPVVDAVDVSSLRLIMYGASGIPEAALRRAIGRFGPVLCQSYGQTEVPSAISYLPPEDHVIDRADGRPSKLGSAGRPFSTIEVRVVGEDGSRLGDDEEGEIVVRSPHRMREYMHDPERTAMVLDGEWVRTGDLGRLDPEGYIWISGRRNDVIISGGMNVNPVEVEEALYAHDDVVEAVVYGIDHPEWIETVAAAVVLRDGRATSAELMAFCRERLAGYKRPKVVRIVGELPKNKYGKFDRRAVRDGHVAADDVEHSR